MKVIVAIDSFKGCLSSEEANQAAAEGIRHACPHAQIISVPVSDGGEGFLDAIYVSTGGHWINATVNDPLMRPVIAKYLLQGKEAFIEMAQANGLSLLSPVERNPLLTSTYGTGQLVADAIRRGAEHIIVGLGGSATSDAGKGMLRALTDAFSTDGTWQGIHSISSIRFTIATDVNNPLYGPNGAAHVFGPQKGATPDMVLQLDRQARQFAELSAQQLGHDCSYTPGAGAAGGLGYAFLQYLHADVQPGIQLLLQTVHFDQIIRDADLVITGEGSADSQTLMGKLPMGILQYAPKVPVFLIAGQVKNQDLLQQAGFAHVTSINSERLPLQEAIKKEVALQNISNTTSQLIQGTF